MIIMKIFPLSCWIVVLSAFATAAAQTRHVDLRQWGYAPPLRTYANSVFREGPGDPQLLSFFTNGDLIVGFVTRENSGLTTREHSLMNLHAITFSEEGVFRSKREFSTTDWYGNELFTANKDELLVRMGTDLVLYSQDNKQLAKRELQNRNPLVFSLPNHNAFVTESTRGDLAHFQRVLELLDSQSLETINTCFCTKCWLLSASNHNMLIDNTDDYHPVFRTAVIQFCGPLQFKYEWRIDTKEHANWATLTDDSHFLLAGGMAPIEFFDRGTRQWKDSFNQKHDEVDRKVAIDEKGDRFAVLVQTYVGNSDFWDLNGRLKSERIVVYNSASGKRLAEIPVEHLPSIIFNFKLSPDGKLLAILSDGDLQLNSIKTQ